MSLKNINAVIGTEDLTPRVIAPDGPQGGKVILGFTNPNQESELKAAVEASGKGFSIKNIKAIASELKIPVVDH